MAPALTLLTAAVALLLPAATTSASCADELRASCPLRQYRSREACDVCCGRHQHALRAAACAAADCEVYCSSEATTCETVEPSCSPRCGSAIAAALARCSAGGGGTVQLVAGEYHVDDTATQIALSGLSDVALVGAAGTGGFRTAGPDPTATTLMFHGIRSAFSVSDSARVSFTSLQIDMARQPYTYGQCVAVDADSFTLEFDVGAYPFPAPVPSWMTKVQAVMGFDPSIWRMAQGAVDIYATADPLNCSISAPGRLLVRGAGSGASNPGVHVTQGDYYILRHQIYSFNAFSFNNVTAPTLSDVTIWSIPGMGFYFGKSTDITIRNSSVRARPGRPMSITADASHVEEASGSVHLDGVHFEQQGDDGLNVHGVFHDVRKILSPAPSPTLSLQLGSRPAGLLFGKPSPVNIGGRYQFRNRSTWAIEGVGVLKSTSIDSSNIQTAEFEFEGGASSASAISQYSMLTDISLEPSVLVENSFFGNNRARGALIKTSNVIVRNNTFGNTSDHCVLAFPDGCYWFESNGFKNWTLKDNLFDNCGSAGGGAGTPPSDVFVAACAPHWAEGKPTAQGDPILVGQPFQDGAIVGNTFLQRSSTHAAVELYGFDGLLVRNNAVTASGRAAKGRHGLGAVRTRQCSGLCDSFDGFSVTTKGVSVHGWIVDTALKAPQVSSPLVFKIDGRAVATSVANQSRPDLVPGVCSNPAHGFSLTLGPAIATPLLTGNHTLAVFARRGDGTLQEVHGSPMCANRFRRSCGFPDDCSCGAPLPPRLKISNSISCHADDSNTCDGQPCTYSSAGCVPT